MPLLRQLRRDFGVIIAGVASVAFLSACALANYRSIRSIERTKSTLDQAHAIRELLNRAVKLALDCETGARGFALTREEEFLEPLLLAESAIQPVLTELGAVTADNQAQAARVSALVSTVYGQLNASHEMVRLARNGAKSAAIIDHMRRQKKLTDDIRALIDEIQSGEHELQLVSASAVAAARSAAALAWSMLTIQVLLWTALGWAIWRSARAHALVTICAWSKTISFGGEWITFEEYLSRRFGLRATHGVSPNEAEKLLAKLEKDGPEAS
jgi:CHASE3 domain sensor protein